MIFNMISTGCQDAKMPGMPRTVVALLGLLMLVGCNGGEDYNLLDSKQIVLRGPQEELIGLKAEIADDPAEVQEGLMHRKELPEGRAMLFIFTEEQVLSFWMKNTLIPLDVIYFDRQNKFVSSRTMEPCEKDPCRSYSSGAPSLTALEVPAGFVEENRVGIGWSLVR